MWVEFRSISVCTDELLNDILDMGEWFCLCVFILPDALEKAERWEQRASELKAFLISFPEHDADIDNYCTER